MFKQILAIKASRKPLKYFRSLLLSHSEQDVGSKVCAAMTIELLNKKFQLDFASAQDFADSSHDIKTAYIDKIATYTEHLVSKEKQNDCPKGGANGAALFQMWLAALAWKQFATADAMAEQLEKLNRLGFKAKSALSA